MTNSLSSAVLSVDVEEWFNLLQIDSVPEIDKWHLLEARVENAFRSLMQLCDQHSVRMTCFFLGWIAERYPHLVREAAAAGHEIASHGYTHELAYRMGQAQFAADIRRSKTLLEDIAGFAVLGYRAPGFSCIEKTPWFFEELANAGFLYDSSVFPARRSHGGIPGAAIAPYAIQVAARTMAEFPISTVSVLGQRVCMFGGGYLRIFPRRIVRYMGRRVLSDGRPLVIYLHPREIDLDHPRLKMGLRRRFKSYVGLASMTQKLHMLLTSFSFARFCDLVPVVLDDGVRTDSQAYPVRTEELAEV